MLPAVRGDVIVVKAAPTAPAALVETAAHAQVATRHEGCGVAGAVGETGVLGQDERGDGAGAHAGPGHGQGGDPGPDVADLGDVLHPFGQSEDGVGQCARGEGEEQRLAQHRRGGAGACAGVPAPGAARAVGDDAGRQEDDAGGRAGGGKEVEEKRGEEVDATDDGVVRAFMRDVFVGAVLREEEGAERTAVVAEAVAALAGRVDGAETVEGETVVVEVGDGGGRWRTVEEPLYIRERGLCACDGVVRRT